MVKPHRTALVVDDDPEVAESHARLLGRLGLEAIVETRPDRVPWRIEVTPAIEIVLLDLRMPSMDGLELLRQIKSRRPELGVVMATVVSDVEQAVEAIKSGAYNYLLKPLQPDRLGRVLDSYFSNRPRPVRDDPRFAGFVTGYRSFEAIFDRVRVYAEADVPVLILGETGTGKELIAQLLHSLSPRAGERFTAVNVAAVPTHLFEAELFGHARGSFTGAVQDREGYFEGAGRGTLFLDEIGELGTDLQAKLLRVLQERRFARVGEREDREVRARLLFASNLDLAAEAREGRFRADLYYRVSSHVISVPPLRERPDDVQLLASYFLGKYVAQFGRAVEGFTEEAMAALRRYAFPGNVRELEGIVSGSVLLERTPSVRLETLPPHVRTAEGQSDDMEAQKHRAVMSVLAKCDGNHARAAKMLGIARVTLLRILRNGPLGRAGEEA